MRYQVNSGKGAALDRPVDGNIIAAEARLTAALASRLLKISFEEYYQDVIAQIENLLENIDVSKLHAEMTRIEGITEFEIA